MFHHIDTLEVCKLWQVMGKCHCVPMILGVLQVGFNAGAAEKITKLGSLIELSKWIRKAGYPNWGDVLVTNINIATCNY